MNTLINKAKAIITSNRGTRKVPITKEGIELVVAHLNGDFTFSQTEKALGIKSGELYSYIVIAIRNGIGTGLVKVTYIKK